jgi:error-prone DNA polymerase
MGFYPPASLVRDAQRRGVRTLPPDVNASAAQAVLEEGAVRMGLDYVASLGTDGAEAVVAARESGGPFADVSDLARRVQVEQAKLEALVNAGACDCLGERRRDLLWELGLVHRPQSVAGSGGEAKQLALPLDPTVETPELRDLTPWERMLADYRGTGVSVGVHPIELLRGHLPREVLTSEQLNAASHGSRVAFAGMAVARQRPSTANGVVFMLLEDELGQVNLIVPPQVYDRHRAVVRGEPLLLARGRFERVGENRNVLVASVETLGPIARRLAGTIEVADSLPSAHHFGHR